MNPWLIGGSALALAVVVGLWQIQVSRMEAAHFRAMSAEQQKTRDVQGQFDGYKLQVEQTVSNSARQHAADLQSQIDRNEELADANDRLRGQYLAADRDRTEASRQLLRILNDAPMADVSPLDPASVWFYDELRRRQTGAAPASDPAPGRSQD